MFFTRKELETFEDQSLAPYGIRSKDTKGRDYPEDEPEYRTIYQRDRDRIDGLMAKAPNNNAAKVATRQSGK